MRKVTQIRYYGDSNNKNSPLPEGVKSLKEGLSNGNIFNNYLPMKQIGIQTIPGVQFYLNNGYDPITIGSTGIYELNVDNLTDITSLWFNPISLDQIDNSPSTTYLIVDMLYEVKDKEGE